MRKNEANPVVSGFFVVGLADVLQRSDEVIQNLGGHHDAIPVGAHFLRDAYHSSPGVGLEVDIECLSVRNDFFRANNIVFHCNLGLLL